MKKFLFVLIIIFLFSCEEETKKCSDLEYIKTSDISVYFSPNNNLESILADMLREAKESIDVAIYDLTNEIIVDALISNHKKGINIRVYIDKNVRPPEQVLIDKLKNNNIPVKVSIPSNWTNVNSGFAIMHNKFIVVDQEIVLTGSYNFTRNAEENNRENFIIKNALIASKYQEEFDRYWLNP